MEQTEQLGPSRLGGVGGGRLGSGVGQWESRTGVKELGGWGGVGVQVAELHPSQQKLQGRQSLTRRR